MKNETISSGDTLSEVAETPEKVERPEPLPRALRKKLKMIETYNSDTIRYTDVLSYYQNALSKTPRITPEEEIYLATRYRKYGDKDSLTIMVGANLRLVYSIANKNRHTNVDFLDLLQEGNVGLVRGVKKYDPARGTRMSTHLSWWIRQAVLRSLAEKSRAIRIPVHVNDAIIRLRNKNREVEIRQGRPATEKELVELSGFTVAHVRKYLTAEKEMTSLNVPIGPSSDNEQLDIVADKTTPSYYQGLMVDDFWKVFKNARACLAEREQIIITGRYPAPGETGKTLEELSAELHITKERIRQVEKDIKVKLKAILIEQGTLSSGDIFEDE